MTSVFEQIASVAIAVIMVTLVVLTATLLAMAWHFRATYHKLNKLLDQMNGGFAPIMGKAHDISDNVNFITTSIRGDVRRVSDTIDLANERVQHAVVLTEQRIHEFNALLSLVQEEAEQLFVSTASTVRGVRRGAAAFRDRSGMDLASDELDAADSADDLEIEENSDGYDDSSDPEPTPPAPFAGPAAPRVRRRDRTP
ncbi:MAG TPA: hypothetical protein VK636_20010 [Gemmatimonadaceae bacterium]|nr:hypothetical protein [Gemmatimonadaceae bacterium]